VNLQLLRAEPDPRRVEQDKVRALRPVVRHLQLLQRVDDDRPLVLQRELLLPEEIVLSLILEPDCDRLLQ